MNQENEITENKSSMLVLPTLTKEDNELIDKAEIIIKKTYLDALSSREATVVPCSSEIQSKNINDFCRLYKINSLVYEKGEKFSDKIVSVYKAVQLSGGSIVLIIDANNQKNNNSVDIYIGTKRNDTNKQALNDATSTLSNSLKGNFPGTELGKLLNEDDSTKLIQKLITFHKGENPSISTVTGIAAPRTKEETAERKFVQGIEKFIDAMQGKKYTLMVIADPVSQENIEVMRDWYEKLGSVLTPLSQFSLTVTEGGSVSFGQSVSTGKSHSLNNSISNSLSSTHSVSTNTSHSVTTSGKSGFFSRKTTTETESTSKSVSNSKTTGISTTQGVTEGTSRTEQVSETESYQMSKGMQRTFENKKIKSLLSKIDIQLERLESSEDLGMWNCAAYIFSDNDSDTILCSSTYQSLLRGENSSLEKGYAIHWDENKVEAILPYLEKLQHPLFDLGESIITTPSSMITSSELAIHAGLPQKSVIGLPVYEMASFAREPRLRGNSNFSDKTISLGNVYHAGQEVKNLPLKLDLQSLTMHTFITGSTGSGKSNAVYHLIKQISKCKTLENKDISFLVIEPAKGEYKHIFGNRQDVAVYGVNPKSAPLLRINPFCFNSEKIFITQHISKLLAIFNVCWPMEGAMPDFLKAAVENAYTELGWDLKTGDAIDTTLFPDFQDLCKQLKKGIENSDYSDEVKGNYMGALLTRIQSLTNGIYSQIFTNNPLLDSDLFDKNVIIDLTGENTDVQSLIMGLLVFKMQEHRIAQGGMNKALNHVTVLEEAHNLLKNTALSPSSVSSTLRSSSVEIISNAIAEMRTFGEGFIIVDQSPSMLDRSVIRNTNTKIVLRLPEYEDRELVGKAENLNQEQINEIARLETGVASVYQNNWIESVLCKVSRFETGNSIFDIETTIKSSKNNLIPLTPSMKQKVFSQLYGAKSTKLKREEILSVDMPASIKKSIINLLKSESAKISQNHLPILQYLLPKTFELAQKNNDRALLKASILTETETDHLIGLEDIIDKFTKNI
ncbi:MAG: DUF87 domain-containing protein [Candidatus Treponema excrementipullorum]|nr:DUF87 domain-containing protein [Candidatus Treponema excrementipullorum]